MAAFRIVLEFVESNGATFEEVYYKDASSPNDALDWSDALQANRLKLLHPLNTLQRARASQVGANRVTGTKIVALPGTWTPAGAISDLNPLPVGAAIVLTLAGATGGQRKLWLRGGPKEWYSRNPTTGKDDPSAQFNNAMKLYLNALKANSWGILRLKPAAPVGGGALAPIKIKSVDGNASPGISLVTLASPPGYPFPGRIIIGQASKKDLPGLNGHWSLLEAPAGAVIKIAYTTPANTVVITNQGYSRQEEYQAISVINPDNSGFDHMGTRTAKNPLSRSRGARRAARIRQLA